MGVPEINHISWGLAKASLMPIRDAMQWIEGGIRSA